VFSTSGQTTREAEMTTTTPLLTSTIPAVTDGKDVKLMASRPSLFRNLAGKARPVLDLVKSGEDDISEDDILSNPRSFKLPIFSVGSDDASINLMKTVDATDELQSRKAHEGNTKEVDNCEEKIKSISGATKPIPRLNLFRSFDTFRKKSIHNNE
jgi:hypothetical protein